MSVLVLPLELAKRVDRGLKTVHRIKPSRGRRRPDLDESVPVQVRSRAGGRTSIVTLCRVQILDVDDGYLHEVTTRELRADGLQTRGEYFAWWREAIEGVKPPASADEPYGDVPVWVIRFQIEQRRFLAAHPGLTQLDAESAVAHGYSQSPGSGLAGEQEVIEPVGPRWNQKLELDRRIKWAEERKIIAASIERLMADPHMRSEIAGDLRVLERRLAAIDRQLHGVAA